MIICHCAKFGAFFTKFTIIVFRHLAMPMYYNRPTSQKEKTINHHVTVIRLCKRRLDLEI